MTFKTTLFAGAAVCLLAAGPRLTAQQPPRGQTQPGQTPPGQTQSGPTSPGPAPTGPVLRVAVTTVQVDAVVTDRDGRQVTDLKPEDFEIEQDGRKQTISTFAYFAEA